MERNIYYSKKFSILLILVLLLQSLSTSFVSVANAATETESLSPEPTVEDLYFTKKGQSEKIQELTVEGKDFFVDLVLEDSGDVAAEIQLPEGVSANTETLTDGVNYEEETRTLRVDWTTFTAVENKKRASLSFTTSLEDRGSLKATTVREGQLFYSLPLTITPMIAETATSTEEAETSEEVLPTSEDPATEEASVEDSEQDAGSTAPLEKPASETTSTTNNVVTDSNLWLTYKFDSFPKGTVDQLFAVNGSANVPDNAEFIRLTEATPLQSGSAFNKNGICMKDDYSFSTGFSFKMSNPSSEGPSDGLTFTIQTGTLGSPNNGGSLGFYDIKPSFTVKYDTFLNTDYRDPSANYIGIAKDGSPVNQEGWFNDLDQYNAVNGTNFLLSNGTTYYTWIDYDGLNKNVQVLLSTSSDRASAHTILDVNNIDLGTLFGGAPIHAGFTGTTGSPNYETHDIYNWYFINDYAPLSTLSQQNNYKQAPSSVEVTTDPAAQPGEYKVTATLLDPLGNPVQDASLDSFTSTSGELTGPNGEPLADLVSDAEGKIHALLKNGDHSTDVTISAAVGCENDTATIPASEEPPIDPPNACTADGSHLTYKFDGFSNENLSQFSVNGVAEVPAGENFLRLTPSAEYQAGGVFNKTPLTLKNNYSFSTAFSFKMSDPVIPGDGLTFTIQGDTSSALTNGGGLGYYGIQPSFAVKFDTYLNSNTGDPSANYIGLAENGSVTNQTGWYTDLDQYNSENGTNYILSNGNMYYTWIDYDGLTKNVKVFLGTSPDRASAEKVLDVNNIDLGSIFEGKPIYAGFTAATGLAIENHDIYSWYFVNNATPIGTPCVTAEKTVSPQGEVYAGDEVTYELTVKNNGGEIATNVVFEDAIPEGTEYVTGSLKITNGPVTGDLTDEVDTDAGHFDGTKVIVQLGDVPNTTDLPDGITVQFKVRALSTDSTKVIANKASVAYDNLLLNKKETTETNEVTSTVVPGEVINACGAPVALINGSFEEPPNAGPFVPASQVPGWDTTDSTGIIEYWSDERIDYDTGKYVEAAKGKQYVELEAYEAGKSLYQIVDTTYLQGESIYWRIAHRGRVGTDTMQVIIGPSLSQADPQIPNGQTTPDISDGYTEWGYYTGSYTVPKGQTVTIFAFKSISTAASGPGTGNFLDDIFLGTEPCVIAEKTVSPEGEIHADDEMTYEVNIKNNGGDIAANVVFEDAIPEGTEFIPGSIKVDGQSVDDSHFDNQNNKVVIDLGDLPNTTDLPEGITVQFKVKALTSYIGMTVTNKAQVKYKNLLTNEDESIETNEVITSIEERLSVLESEKSAVLKEKAEGNTDEGHVEVGDTLLYTIKTRNTIENGVVTDLVISDTLPKGLSYVPGTLKVDGIEVTDAEDDDAGHFVNGQITGRFGDVTDTEEHMVTFLVTVDNGQAGSDITNTATVSGGNISTPDKPVEIVKVYPREATLESMKIAVNAEEGKETFEVGDTVVYTIKARNVVSESIVKNFTISDKLIEGLEYVEGSLTTDPDIGATFENGTLTANFGEVTDTEWRTVTFHAKIQLGQSGKELKNIATVEGEDVPPTHPEVPIQVDPKGPKLESKKSAELVKKADGNNDAEHPEVGDTIRYTITTRNTIQDSLVENLVITDTIPAGLTYVKDSLEVGGIKVTDAEDEDAGYVADGKVEGTFGNVTDTAEHTVTFLVTVDHGQSGANITNTATVSGGNISTPDKPSDIVKVYPRDAALESEKSAVNAEEGKETFKVGDTIVYTIKARNEVSDSVVTNLTISDKLPAGLEFVENSLQVSHDGKGEFKDGSVTAVFGDVADTEWRTVTFKAKILSGQSGKNIENVAKVTADNVEEPEEPSTTTKVVPADISLVKKADKAKARVGEIITYTIEAKNGENGGIWNGIIRDKLSAHVQLVPQTTTLNGATLKDTNVWNQGELTVQPVVLHAGESAVITFQVKVLPSALKTTVENIATASDPNEPGSDISTPPTKTDITDDGDNTGGETPGGDDNTGGETPGEDGNTDGETPGEDGNTGGETPGGDGDTDGETPGEDGNTGGETPGEDGNTGEEKPDEDGNTDGENPSENGNTDEESADGDNTNTDGNTGGSTDSKEKPVGTEPAVPEGSPVSTEKQQKLPQTGEAQTNVMIFVGLLMIGVALTGLLRRKRLD